jgi:hypothetical protein
MRLRHRSDMLGLIFGAARLGDPQSGDTRQRDQGAADSQVHEDRRLECPLMDNRNHRIGHFCPGVQTCLFAVIILLEVPFTP